jgi:hypothetical protein
MRGLGISSLLALALGCTNGSTVHTLGVTTGVTNGDEGGAGETPPQDDAASGDQVGVPDDDATDEPAWVNGAYLTCSWKQIVSEAEAEFGCEARGADGAVLVATETASWAASIPGETNRVNVTEIFPDEPLSVVWEMPSAQLPDVLVTLTMAGEELGAPLVEILPGFDDPADLGACLKGTEGLTACLQSVGIYLGSGAATPNPPAPPPSPGVPPPTANVGGVDYYLGAAGESCDQVCAAAGGAPQQATIDVIGSGGTALQSVDALAAYGHVSVFDGQSATEGIGCHVSAADSGVRVTNPPTTQGAKAAGVRRVCGC